MLKLCARTAQELLEEPITEADWVIEDLLPVGAHILAGAPKIGKSWMVLAMGLAVSMGTPFWDYAVCQGSVLYLCLEDTYARVKKRLWKLTDEANDRFYLANSAATIKDSLVEQIDYFVITHPDLKLVFIDTFQKVRSPTCDSIYAADYGDFLALKAVADKHSLAMMVVHHTRKMADEDIMNTVSGSSGITGSADSIWVLKRASRGVGDATLTITGRDIEFRELKLALRDCRWNLIERTSEEELEEREIPDCVLKVVEFMNAKIAEDDEIHTKLISVFDSELLNATKVQFHWAGRSSRGVTQFDGHELEKIIFSNQITIDESKATEYLEYLISL